MELHIVGLLTDAQSPNEGPRKHAEYQLRQQYSSPEFPFALIQIGSHKDIALGVRQAALLYLKTFVLACWSEQFDEFIGQYYGDIERRTQIRQSVLALALSENDDRKIKSAAGLVVSKIAIADYPDDWPDLLETVLRVAANGSQGQLHGALKVLSELVDECFNDEQFFSVAKRLVNVLHDIAIDEAKKPTLRALAVSVFRSCFDTLEMVLEDHKTEVKAFAEEAVAGWMAFFTTTLKVSLPPLLLDGGKDQDREQSEVYRGLIALKLQVVKCLMRIRNVFPSTLSPHSVSLFFAIWQELSVLQSQYHQMFIDDERQSRLEDADGLPYTLDFLVVEELDFMQSCFRAPPVRKELDQQLRSHDAEGSTWVTEAMKTAVAYAQITTEEEGLWDFDVNVFLSEEVNLTANYTPRTACGDLVIKLGEWLNSTAVEGLLAYTKTVYLSDSSWKAKEAALYLLNQLLGEFQDVEKNIGAESAKGYVEFIRHAMEEEAAFLRARGYLVAGSLCRTSGNALLPIAVSFMQASLSAITEDSSEVVKVSCIRALQYYLAVLPADMSLPQQPAVVHALANFFNTHDFNDLDDSDDLLMAIIETLRDGIMLDTNTCLSNGSLDLLFSVASRGASNFQIALLVSECFEDISETIAEKGDAQYAELSRKVLPSLMGAFDVATLTEENSLANLAAELLSVLAVNGTSPLPPGFVVMVMPRLIRLLMGSTDDELLKSATAAVKHMVSHDPEQVFTYQDESGKTGLEIVLYIIDRLLSPMINDNAGAEVGGLAAEVVEKAGSGRLGPFLEQLLQAVASRLATATQAQFIQSLILVFARLSLISAQEVVGFLADVQIGEYSGLHVVLSKWLENSITFVGYDTIRQNVVALSRLYELHDPRFAAIQVKGDLIVPQSDRIMTRSRAKQTPERYTMISAQVKIIKILVEELLASSGNRAFESGAHNVDDDDDEDDEEWEDDPTDFLDLGSGMTKSQLMALESEDATAFTRGKDDETQNYLLEFFRSAARTPQFMADFPSLTDEEQKKLRSIN